MYAKTALFECALGAEAVLRTVGVHACVFGVPADSYVGVCMHACADGMRVGIPRACLCVCVCAHACVMCLRVHMHVCMSACVRACVEGYSVE
jgi:hypothetical protein